jgi:hypothetical protein
VTGRFATRKQAKLKYSNAILEDLDRRSGRALDGRLIASWPALIERRLSRDMVETLP